MRTDMTLFRRPCRESGETYAVASNLWFDEVVSSSRAEGRSTTDVLISPFQLAGTSRVYWRPTHITHLSRVEKRSDTWVDL